MPTQKAKEVLSKHWDGNLPISPEKIAKSLGFSVRTGLPDEIYSGKAFTENNVKVIEYKTTEPALRQRFTIAHELAHHLLGHTDGGHKFRDSVNEFNLYQSDPFEIQANKFAAELLMPKEAVEYLIMKKNITSLEELAKLFFVSTVAMKFRLKNLGWLPHER